MAPPAVDDRLGARSSAMTKATTQPAVRAEGRSPRQARSPPAWRIETRASELRRRSRARVDGPGWWGSGRRTSCQLESASRRAQTCRRLGWRLWVPKRKHSMSTRRRRLDPSDVHSHWVVTVRTAGSVSATHQLVSSQRTRMGARSPRSASAWPPTAREPLAFPLFSRAHNAV